MVGRYTKAMHSSLLTHSAPQLQSILNGLRGALAQEGCGQVRGITHQRHPPTRVHLQEGGRGEADWSRSRGWVCEAQTRGQADSQEGKRPGTLRLFPCLQETGQVTAAAVAVIYATALVVKPMQPRN